MYPISWTEFDHFWNSFGKNKFPGALELLNIGKLSPENIASSQLVAPGSLRMLRHMPVPTSFLGSLILPPPEVSEERPWFGLVTCYYCMTTENIREGSSVIRQFVALSFVVLRPPLPAMFNCSLRAESLNSIYFTSYVKVKQVCLEIIYRGRDLLL